MRATSNNPAPALGVFIRLGLILSAVWLGATLLLHLFFLPQLSSSRLEQLQSLSRQVALIVAAQAQRDFETNEDTKLQAALSKLNQEVLAEGDFFFEVSVVLLPDGVYMASTNQTLFNRQAHPALVSRLSEVTGKDTKLSMISYQTPEGNVKSYQLMRNFFVQLNTEEQRVGVVQVVAGYSGILTQTAVWLWILSFLFLALIWGILIFASAFSQDLLQPYTKILDSLLSKNYELRLPASHLEQMQNLNQGFHKLAQQLKADYQEKQQIAAKMLETSPSHPSAALTEASLRKAELTCLCARIPDVQNLVAHEAPEQILSFIQKHLENLSPLVIDNGGQVVKVLGDKVYVLFEGINSINNALRTSLQLVARWKELNHERKVRGLKLLEYGIGIHTALGISGNFNQADSFTFLGDSARLAEYFCSCSRNGEILIGAQILERAHGSFKHHVVTGRKAADYAERDEIFCITDSLTMGERPSLPGKAGNGKVKERIVRPESSNITDMLEETLADTPLEVNVREERQALPDISVEATRIFQDKD